MSTATQASFARLHGVSRKTVTDWKARGYLRLSGGSVDVEASNAALSAVGKSRLSPVTLSRRVATNVRNAGGVVVAGNSAWSAEMGHRHAAAYPVVATLATVVDGTAIDVIETLRGRVPFAELRPFVEEVIARVRKGAVECLDEGETPPGFDSWGDHPWFTGPPLTDAEWQEIAEEVAHGHAG